MKHETAVRASLCAVIQHDLEAVRRMDAELVSLRAALSAGQHGFREAAAAGYLLHNIYNAIENSFEQISRTFENHVTDPGRWHKELLDKMFLAIPGVRPAVLPESLRGAVNELRGFRHMFRHSYDFQIDPVRLDRLCQVWGTTQGSLCAALESFSRWLLSASEQPDGPPPPTPMT